LLLGVGAFAAYKFIFRGAKDLKNSNVDKHMNFSSVDSMFNANDTSSLRLFSNKILSVSGTIKSITQEDSSATVTLGADGGMNTVTCQVDARHLNDVKTFVNAQKVTLKGECTGYNIDEMVGGDLQLKGCVSDK
jgi:hypothetical protein